MEKTIHEVVFNSSGVPDNYLVGTIRQGTKNVDQLSMRFEDYNNEDLVVLIKATRGDGELAPTGLIALPRLDPLTNLVWYDFTFGQQEDLTNAGSWFTEVDENLKLNISLVKQDDAEVNLLKVYLTSKIEFIVENTEGFNLGSEYNWEIIEGFLALLSLKASFVYVDNAVAVLESSINAKLDLKDSIVNVNNKLFLKADKTALNAHIGETTSAHNIPAQIDGKIATHNGAESNSHIDMRNNIATNISDIATINDTTIPAIKSDITDIENSKITSEERTKLSGIETTAQVNKIESIIVNSIVQTITSKSIDLTTDVKNMIDTEITALIGEAPDLLDTLKEIAEALNNDPDFYNTITGMINEKLDTDFSTFTNQATVKNTDILAINDGAAVKKITVENLLAEVYLELANKISNIDLINELPDDLIYGGENVELVEPVVTVYNAERLDGKLENELDVNSAVYDSDSNIIKDTYIKNTDVISKATNADKILFDGSYVSIGSTSVNYSTNSGTAATADKLNNKEEANLSVASAVNATTNINGKAITSIFESDGTTVKEATNSGKLNNKLEANLSVADSVKLNGFVDTDFVKKPIVVWNDGQNTQTFTNSNIMNANTFTPDSDRSFKLLNIQLETPIVLSITEEQYLNKKYTLTYAINSGFNDAYIRAGIGVSHNTHTFKGFKNYPNLGYSRDLNIGSITGSSVLAMTICQIDKVLHTYSAATEELTISSLNLVLWFPNSIPSFSGLNNYDGSHQYKIYIMEIKESE